MARHLIDYDSTLADTQALRLETVNAHFGTNYTPDMVTSWHNSYMTDEEQAFMWSDACFLNEQLQLNARPVRGAIQGVTMLLAQGHELMVVSDRPLSLFDVTRQWLDDHNLDMVRLLFTRHKHSQSTESTLKTKVQAAYQHRLSIVIEDAPHHAAVFAEKNWIDHVYLLDMPYNQGVEHSKVHRVADWAEIVRREQHETQ